MTLMFRFRVPVALSVGKSGGSEEGIEKKDTKGAIKEERNAARAGKGCA